MKKITKRLCVAVSVLSVAAGSMAVNVPIVAPAGINVIKLRKIFKMY